MKSDPGTGGAMLPGLSLEGEEAAAGFTLIDRLLQEQASLTAVARFARKHERHEFPAQARYYRDLIPLEKPAGDEQFGFSVDLDKCTGCKACVSACHSLNGLDEGETWRDIGLLHALERKQSYQQTITTACHHCADPACLNGCPVKAYDKDAETGIVRHLDDQCIGCQYCILKCPYDVPKYSAKRGIVRKCDMCYSRLAVGEAPACVQACPDEAIRIVKVSRREIEARAQVQGRMIPGAFDSNYTKPSTAYRSSRGVPDQAAAGDRKIFRPQHAHAPLIAMLLLTQASAGLFAGGAVLALMLPEFYAERGGLITLVAWILLQAGLAASVLHLGRPLGAWRAFLGWRTSWMSREILAFGLFAGLATLAAAASNKEYLQESLPIFSGTELSFQIPPVIPVVLMIFTAGCGVLAVFCSAMIYIDTRRFFWKADLSLGKFFGTAIFLGTVLMGGIFWLTGSTPEDLSRAGQISLAAAAAGAILLFWEKELLRKALRAADSEWHISALAISIHLAELLQIRRFCFTVAMLFLVAGPFVGGTMGQVMGIAAVVPALACQLIERFFYFVAVEAPRMPGTPG